MEERMRKVVATIGVAGLLLCAGQAARADEQSNDWQLEGLDNLMQGMDDLLKSIPRYQAPIIDENGDIIIRRAPREREFDPSVRPREPEFVDI
jgi:hypothetical protein